MVTYTKLYEMKIPGCHISREIQIKLCSFLLKSLHTNPEPLSSPPGDSSVCLILNIQNALMCWENVL